jgi:hypothetical protein
VKMARNVPLVATAVVLAALVVAGCGSQAAKPPSKPTAGRPRALAESTAAPPALRHLPQDAATVWAVGDGADGGDGGRALARRIIAGRPDLFLYLGDVYEAGTAAEFATHYHALYGPLAPRTAPTPGNHEYPQHAVGYDPYWRGIFGVSLPSTYRVTIAGWDVLSVNSEAPHDPASAQVAWLRRQVATGGTCRIVFWHRPRLSAGLHGDAADMAPVWDAVRGHAALVLNGHDHTSQRLKPIGGTTEFVAGAGGHRPYPLNAADPRLAYGSTGTPTALRLRLTHGVARVSFVSSDGVVRDHRTVGCR